MAFVVEPLVSTTAESILVWCGVTSPTPTETLVAGLAAQAAEDAIRFYRRTEADSPIEDEYKSLAVEMGVYLYNKRGVDGVLSFSENGVAQSFEAGSIPKSMLSRITLPATTG